MLATHDDNGRLRPAPRSERMCRLMQRRLFIALLALTVIAAAQTGPEGAHVDLYFPQLADGGDQIQQWQTTFTFINRNASAADVVLRIYGNDGRGMELDLGMGLSSEHRFTIFPSGVRVLRSKVASPSINVGWAIAESSVPLQATVAFRMFANGVPQQEVTAEPTLPTSSYISVANRELGIAIGNPFKDASIPVLMRLRQPGVVGGDQVVHVPALGHKSFVLSQYYPNMPSDYSGLVELRPGHSWDRFVAWTMHTEQDVRSALPSGASERPIAVWERIRLVYSRILDAAKRLQMLNSAPTLDISYERKIDAYAIGDHTIRVNAAVSELIGDSQSELAAVIGHEMGHIIQMQTGNQADDPANREFDADIKAAILALFSGYDPYAAAGALAKLAMATGTAGLTTEFGGQLAPDAHNLFNARLENVYQNLVRACNSSLRVKQACDTSRNLVHPGFPDSTPLRSGSRTR